MNAQEMPKANSRLLVEIIESETVAYHQGTRQIHRLEPAASKVFSLCDGKTLRSEAANIAFPEESTDSTAWRPSCSRWRKKA
jgi:hypothetical protein